MKSERGALWLSTVTALLIGCVGIGTSIASNSQAILLDGLFNLSYFIIALLTLKVAKLAALPESEDFPLGYSYLEPLVNGSKGIFILGISLLALFDALGALMRGGRAIDAGAGIGYAIFATVTSAIVAILLNRAHRSTVSPLVRTDAESWKVNSYISAVILVTFAAIPAASAMGGGALAPYVDPFLVSVVVVISISVPVRIAWQALMAMLNKAPSSQVRKPIIAAVRDALSDLPTRAVDVSMVWPRSKLYVVSHVLLPEDYTSVDLRTFDDIRKNVSDRVREFHENSVVDVLFTGDKKWTLSGAAMAPFDSGNRNAVRG